MCLVAVIVDARSRLVANDSKLGLTMCYYEVLYLS